MDAVRFHNVTTDSLEIVNFLVAAGALAALVTPRQEVNEVLVLLMLGMTAPSAGSVTVLGCEVTAASPEDLYELRRRVAVVHPSGGLVSNLKVWENLILPLEYHSGLAPEEIEERGLAVLRRLRYEGGLMDLPGPLPLYKKRLIGLGRAMLAEPELIIYDGVLNGLGEAEKSLVVETALAYHKEREGRASLFITANPETIRDIAFDSRVTLGGNA